MYNKFVFGVLVVFVSRCCCEDGSYQACVDKYTRKGYQPWQEWSDHYTCHRYRCEIRDGKYFIAAVGCRKPKIPENAIECHEYIEDENVEFPTCCARLRCVVDSNGEKIIQTRGQPGEVFPEKPWKGHANPTAPMLAPQNPAGEQNAPAALYPARHGGSAGSNHFNKDFNDVDLSSNIRHKDSIIDEPMETKLTLKNKITSHFVENHDKDPKEG